MCRMFIVSIDHRILSDSAHADELIDIDCTTPGLATLCSQCRSIVRECTYERVTITDRNIANLLRTSRVLRYSNLALTRSVDIPRAMSGRDTTIALREILNHTRPVELSLCDDPLSEGIFDNFDSTRLRQVSSPLRVMGSVARRSSTTLESLVVEVGRNNEDFDFPDESPAMTKLRNLEIKDFFPATMQTIPKAFFRFVRSCGTLSRLSLYTDDPELSEKILALCGQTLVELDIYINDLYTYRNPTFNLSTYTSRLELLYSLNTDILRLQPFPRSLRKLDFRTVYQDELDGILSDLRSTAVLHRPRTLSIHITSDDMVSQTEVAALVADILKECKRQDISLEVEYE